MCNPFVEETTQFLFQPLAIKYVNMFWVLFPLFLFKLWLVHANVSQKEKKRKVTTGRDSLESLLTETIEPNLIMVIKIIWK